MKPPKTVMAPAMLALTGLVLSLAAMVSLTPGVAFARGNPTASAGATSGDGGATPSQGSDAAGSPPAPGSGLRVTSVAWLGGVVQIEGNLGAGAAHQPVLIERQGAGGGRWIKTAQTVADDHGIFRALWRARQAGRLTLRAEVQSTRAGTAQATDPAATAAVTVYRSAVATWYGSGSYGRPTACGETMTRRLLGVANRTLPCGTLVQISYRGRTVTVPVVDRGPYTSATWDLTRATAMQLGFTGRQRIGTAIVGRGPAGPSAGSQPDGSGSSGTTGSSAPSSDSAGSGGGTSAGGAVAGP